MERGEETAGVRTGRGAYLRPSVDAPRWKCPCRARGSTRQKEAVSRDYFNPPAFET